MKDIAFHITDIAQNSLRAGADTIRITLRLDGRELELTVSDNGCGMDTQMLRRVVDPFCTSRTTRRVGLGLPFLFQNAEQCGGCAEVRSKPGAGTEVRALFRLDHIDCPPAGDLGETFMQLLAGSSSVNVCLEFSCEGRVFGISTQEIRSVLDGVPTGHPQVACMIRDLLVSNLGEVFGNRLV